MRVVSGIDKRSLTAEMRGESGRETLRRGVSQRSK